MGKGTAAIISDMNQPLGHNVGNALEVAESIECLRGNGEDELVEITMELAAQMLLIAKKAPDEIRRLADVAGEGGLRERPWKNSAR